MSRHHHAAVTSDVYHILHQIKHMPKEEAEQLHGITMNDDGSVFDPTFNKKFESLSEWAEWNAEQDEMEFSEAFGHGKQDYDDYY